MRSIGQLCLLVTLVTSGYAAFVLVVYRNGANRRLLRAASVCGLVAFLSLTAAVGILARALLLRDFSFDYVAHYSSQLLPWQYSLSALWVGQGGSLLLWAWILAGFAGLFRILPGGDSGLRDTAFGVLLADLGFITAIMVFAADPFKPSLAIPKEGMGLSPLLQHPSMLIHPPVIFCAYAAWTIPFALTLAALLSGKLDVIWTQMARPWALGAWAVLLAGLLLGADWAYEELGWGGYWGWDPVENGSLLPWLTGTAFIHGLMAWRARNCLKKTTVALGIATFGLCNFATFLTRSGIFSSVHAFSESPIGWMFLGLMGILIVGGATTMVLNRSLLAPHRSARSLLAREALILVSISLLVAFAAMVMGGTLVAPVSAFVLGRTIVVDPPFYNTVLIPIGLLLLAITAAVPLLRWGEAPGPGQRRALLWSLAAGVLAMPAGYILGVRHAVSAVVVGLATVAVAAFVSSVVLERRRRDGGQNPLGALLDLRRRYAGYGVHLGFIVLAIGITGSALGTQQVEVELSPGEVIRWAGRDIHYRELVQREQSDKLVAEAVLEVSRGRGRPAEVRPARHWHVLQKEWTTEVAIQSTWQGDLYTVLHAAQRDGKAALTLIENPMMRWLWVGGAIAAGCALVAIWPDRRRRASGADHGDESAAKRADVKRQAA